MGKRYTALEASAILNSMVEQLTGEQSTIAELDVHTMATVGELVFSQPTEDVLNALTMAIGKTYVNCKRRKNKFNIIQTEDGDLFTNIRREILIYARKASESGAFNTDTKTNFADGFDNGKNPNGSGVAQSVGNQWEQKLPATKEMYFGGYEVWDDWITIYEHQFKQAFTDASSFIAFINGIQIEKENEIDRTKEAYNRSIFLNHVAMVYDAGDSMPQSKVNLAKMFNDEYDTSYTSEELLTTYLDEFLPFAMAVIRQYSDNMEDDTINYHWTPTKTGYVLPRQTMKADQRLVLFAPIFNKAKTTVLPMVFNPEYLSVENAEMVNYWQNVNDRMKIDVTPAIPDFAGTNSGLQTEGDEVEMNYFLGALFDKDAVKTHYILNSTNTTPLEARKLYRNTFYHMAKGSVSNATRPFIIFYLEDVTTP